MKRTRALALLLPLLLVPAAQGCDSDGPADPGDPLEARRLPAEYQAEADELVAGNNAFALDLYGELRGEKGNLFFSPFSISTAFAMLHAGARTQTEAEMAQVFRFPLAQDRLHLLYRELLASLDRGTAFEGYRLSVANRLWGQVGYGFLPDYLAVTRDAYGAPLEPLDFAADPEACRGTINDWVAEKTEDRIRDLMPRGSIDSLTRLVLTNAIYFKGTWETQFDAEKTAKAPFFVTPGAPVSADMMTVEAEFASGAVDGVSILELPYEGEDLSMIVLLPEELDGLPALEERLTPENLESWVGGLAAREQTVHLPRFEMTRFFPLNETLAGMGMPSAFDPASADFSGINGLRNLCVQAAVHKAFVKVNEEGTEAAAATGISMGETSVPPSFTANRPFLFLIRDNVTGSILFLGRVTDPTATE